MNDLKIINNLIEFEKVIAKTRKKVDHKRKISHIWFEDLDITKLENADLHGITFYDVMFANINCDSRRVDMSNCHFEHCTFIKSYITHGISFLGSEFNDTSIYDSFFQTCDFSMCRIGGHSVIRDTTLLDCNLLDAYLYEPSEAKNVNLMTCNLAVQHASQYWIKVIEATQALYRSQIESPCPQMSAKGEIYARP